MQKGDEVWYRNLRYTIHDVITEEYDNCTSTHYVIKSPVDIKVVSSDDLDDSGTDYSFSIGDRVCYHGDVLEVEDIERDGTDVLYYCWNNRDKSIVVVEESKLNYA
jgi:hypothetical protein